jgi:hypothetical protein
MKKKKDLPRAQTMHLASFVPNFIVAAQLLLLSFVVIHIGYSLIERKKEKRKDTNMVVVKTGQQLCRLLGQWVGSHLIGSMM